MRRPPNSKPLAQVGQPGTDQPPHGCRRARWFVLLGVMVAGCLAGIVAARSLFRADGSPEADGEAAWPYQLPPVPEGVTPNYRALFEEASNAVSEVMTAHPQSTDAVAGLALLYYLGHDRLGEMQCWDRCLELDPAHSLAFSRLVALSQEGGDYQRIVDLAREAIANDPNNTTYRGYLGSALMYLNRPEEAREVLEGQHQLTPGTADTHFVLGKVYDQLGQLEKAERSLETATALAPARLDAWYSLAAVCAKLGESEKAAQYRKRFQQLKAQQQDSESKDNVREEMQDRLFVPVRVAEILTFGAKAYLAQGEEDVAEQCLLRATVVNPKDTESRQILSELCQRQDRLQDVLRWVKELRQLEPNNLLHYRNVGILYARMNRFDEAERVFREICRLAPERGFGYVALAELRMRTGRNLSQAKSMATQGVALEPTAWNYSILAAVSEEAGDLTGARAAIQRAVELDPNNARYRKMHEMIAEKE